MSTRLRHLWIWLRYSLAIAGALVLWAAWQRVAAVAAIQNAVSRDWEFSFYPETATSGTPIWLAPSLDKKIGGWIEEHSPSSGGYDGTVPPKTTNRGYVYSERFRSLFRGSIADVHISYPETFQGDRLGMALARFPKLQRFTLDNNDSDQPPESEWKALCVRLRALPDLEEIDIAGQSLTDDTISPLAGHPRLRSVTVGAGQLSTQSVKTFALLPKLKRLHIEGQYHGKTEWPTKEERQVLINALPNVEVDIWIDEEAPTPPETGAEADRSLAPPPSPP